MGKAFLLLLCLHVQLGALAQKKTAAVKIPLTANRWTFTPGTVSFAEYNGVPALQILANKPPVVLNDFNFTNGTIEFDMAPADSSMFTGIYFRRQDDKESEYFYLRVNGGVKPGVLWAIQYAPIIQGVNLWDMLPQYQGPAAYKKKEWNHIKLVVSGVQMLIYINDMSRPVMEVSRLEGNTTQGGLAFDGKTAIANLVVTPNEVAGLLPAEGIDPVAHDPRYLRDWSVSQPQPLPNGQELFAGALPPKETVWENITAERRGLVNLTRRFGLSESRRVVWLKVKLKAATEQKRVVSLGFSDEIWIFINGQPLFVDKNLYARPIMKAPEGRCSIENASFTLPLKAGENELLVGLSNDFYGWGIIARLDDMEYVEVVK